MCGIAGVFTLTHTPGIEDATAVVRMLDAEVHRGPDDWGLLVPDRLATDSRLGVHPDRVYTYPSFASRAGAVLGTRRLSILDLSPRGRMPMGSSDRRCWVTHNGEIYNYRELRAELDGGEPFRSDTDTEAILRGYINWGNDVIRRLRGMFAFALFEAGPCPRLLLARDRFGIKPLYYYQDGERVIFASEVQALLRSRLVPNELNVEALVRFLQLGSVPSPLTTIKGVVALPAGRCLVASASGMVLKAYWSLRDYAPKSSSRPSSISLDEACSRTRALLDESTRLHLVSDVPLGVFLSGGIDSSGLVALASRFRDVPLTTLSIAFEEPEYNEARYARLVAERYGTDHREIVLRDKDFFDGIPGIFAAMDEPTVDGVNSYFVSRAAKRAGLTVLLSGVGGDEVFLGYRHLRRGASLDRARRLLGLVPVGARRALLQCVKTGWEAVGGAGLEKLQYLELPSVAGMYLAVRGLFSPRQVQELLGISQIEYERYGPALPEHDDRRMSQAVDGFRIFEFEHYLQDQLLKDTDLMSMAHSIEVRVPYLDHRLVEYVVGLPSKTKLAGGMSKPLLLKALGDELPRQVWERPKMGFTFPFGQWLRDGAADVRAMSLEAKLLQAKAVEDIWKRFRAGQVHWSRLWALVVLGRFGTGRAKSAA